MGSASNQTRVKYPSNTGDNFVFDDTGDGDWKRTTRDDIKRWAGNFALASMQDLVDEDLDRYNDEDVVLVENFYPDADGGGDPFRWDADGDKANHNGITVIDPTHSTTPGNAGWWASENSGTTGVFRRREKGFVNVKDAGAKGDGVNDDTSAINAALDAVPQKGGRVKFDDGIYLADYLDIRSNNATRSDQGALIIEGVGIAAPNDSDTKAGATIRFTGSEGLYNTNPSQRLYITNINLQGQGIGAGKLVQQWGEENGHKNIAQLRTFNCGFYDADVGFHIGSLVGSNHLLCNFQNLSKAVYQNNSTSAGDNFVNTTKFDSCRFAGCGNAVGDFAIQLEGTSYCNVTLSNCVGDINNYGFLKHTPNGGVNITDNTRIERSNGSGGTESILIDGSQYFIISDCFDLIPNDDNVVPIRVDDCNRVFWVNSRVSGGNQGEIKIGTNGSKTVSVVSLFNFFADTGLELGSDVTNGATLLNVDGTINNSGNILITKKEGSSSRFSQLAVSRLFENKGSLSLIDIGLGASGGFNAPDGNLDFYRQGSRHIQLQAGVTSFQTVPIRADAGFINQDGGTSSRPSSPSTGQEYFDTDLGHPIWWDGFNWVDAQGTTV